MSDTSQGDGWWLASDGKWYAPQQAASVAPPAPAAAVPAAVATVPPVPAATMASPAPEPVLAGGVGLPAGVAAANPWIRLGSYLLEGVLMAVTLWIGWIIWASMTAGTGQTPAKKLLGLRVVDAASVRPVSFGKMFWMRGIVAPVVAGFAIMFTLGVLLFMPFWDRRNQNLWDKISSTYVVTDPNDAWGTKPNLMNT